MSAPWRCLHAVRAAAPTRCVVPSPSFLAPVLCMPSCMQDQSRCRARAGLERRRRRSIAWTLGDPVSRAPCAGGASMTVDGSTALRAIRADVWGAKKLTWAVLGSILAVVLLVGTGGLIETKKADEILAIQ